MSKDALSVGTTWLPISMTAREPKRRYNAAKRTFPKPSTLAAQAASAANFLRARCPGPQRHSGFSATIEPPNQQCKQYFNVCIPKTGLQCRRKSIRQSPGVTIVIWSFAVSLPNGSVKRVHVLAHAAEIGTGGFEFVGAVKAITDQWIGRTKLENAFEEIKRLKDRLHDENVALREQIETSRLLCLRDVGSSFSFEDCPCGCRACRANRLNSIDHRGDRYRQGTNRARDT